MSKPEDGGSASTLEQAKTDALYDNREPKKIIRLITVMGYVFSVSFVAITLSSYYLFLWEPPNPKLIERYELLDDAQQEFFAARSGQPISFADFHSKISESTLNSNHTNVSFERRIGTDDKDFLPEETSEFFGTMNRNTSMSMLRETLVEILRARRNSSTGPLNNSSNVDKEFFLINNPEKKKSYKNVSTFGNNTDNFGGNKINVALKISPTIISDVKRNVDGFHATDNDVLNGSFRGNQQDRDLMQSTNLEKENFNGTSTVAHIQRNFAEAKNHSASNVFDLFPKNMTLNNLLNPKDKKLET